MLLNFFDELRSRGVPATFRELSDLISALEKGLAFASIRGFYFLSRACMVKDEQNFDKFDKAFSAYFSDISKFSLSSESLDEAKRQLKDSLPEQKEVPELALREESYKGSFGVNKVIAVSYTHLDAADE